jgi:aminotransferase
MTFLSDRVQAIAPSGIRVFFDLVMASKGIISLGVGEPDFLTPWSIRDDAIYHIEKGHTSYTSNKGLTELTEQISNYLNTQFSIEYYPNEILITNGVSEGLDIVFRSFINPGDEVILPEPAYVCYRPLINLCNGVIRTLNTSTTQFIPMADDIETLITPKTKAIVLSYPNNPTGASIEFNELSKIAALAIRHNILIITDEIYADLSFNNFKSIAVIPEIKDRLIYLNGFSKSHAMTGWRIGYICANELFISAINKIHQYSSLCAPTISQYAAIEACKNSSAVSEMKLSYLERARYFTKMMNQVGLTTTLPDGGFYCFSSIKKCNMPSMDFAKKLLKEAQVAVVPGRVFGASGEGYFRSCIATNFDDLKAAAKKIQAAVS